MVPNEKTSSESAKQAEDRTTTLIREFREHYASCVKAHPEHVDRRRDIFEGWAIQKIAALQQCVEQLARQHNQHLVSKAKS